MNTTRKAIAAVAAQALEDLKASMNVPDLLHICVKATFTDPFTGRSGVGSVALCGAKNVHAVWSKRAKTMKPEERATLCRSCVARMS